MTFRIPTAPARRVAGICLATIALALTTLVATAGAADVPRPLRLISSGDSGAAGSGAGFAGASADGTHVFFETAEAIPGTGDNDTARDTYDRRADGTLHLVSTGDSGTVDTSFVGASADGSRVFFTTSEAIPGTGDQNQSFDVYERDGDGSLHLVSTGDAGAPNASFSGASADGTRVFFATGEAIPGTGDANLNLDVYEREPDGTVRLISSGDDGAPNATFVGASADGTRVFFATTEAIPGTGDQNQSFDVYERDGDGSLRLVSPGDPGAPNATFRRASADGTRVLFTTAEAIPGTGDGNQAQDVYERDSDGSVRLVSPGNPGAPDAFFAGASADGSRVFFHTTEAIPGSGDQNQSFDVYERDGDGSLRIVSTGEPGAFNAFFAGASADGSRVWFNTNSPIFGTGDHNAVTDIYERSLAVPSFTSQTQLTGTPSVDSTLLCAAGTVAGERVTTTISWLRDGAPIAGAVDATYRVTLGDRHHAIACRVTASNPIGSASQTTPAVTIDPEPTTTTTTQPEPNVDHARPSVQLLTPACPRRATRRACAQLRARARSWRTLHGTVSDPNPSSGIARVEVNIVRTQGKRCSVYNGRRFVTVSCRTGSSRYVRAKLSGGRWTLALRTLPAGSYTIRVRATDRAGNTTAKPLTRKLRLR